jgi:hypothetical protein
MANADDHDFMSNDDVRHEFELFLAVVSPVMQQCLEHDDPHSRHLDVQSYMAAYT